MMKSQIKIAALLFFAGIASTALSAQSLPNWGIRLSGGFVAPFVVSPEVNYGFQSTGYSLGFELSKFISISEKIEMELAGAFFHDQMPKTREYDQDCLKEIYSTFLSFQDSLMGRDLRLRELRLGPSFRYRVGKAVSVGVGLWGAYTIAARVEDYPKVCDRPRESTWIHFEAGPERKIRRLNLGADVFVSFSLLRSESHRLLLEPGFNGRLFARSEVWRSTYFEAKLKTASGFLRLGYYF